MYVRTYVWSEPEEGSWGNWVMSKVKSLAASFDPASEVTKEEKKKEAVGYVRPYVRTYVRT